MAGVVGLKEKARVFIEEVYQELSLPFLEKRLHEVYSEIELSGTYIHTFEELEHGARMAWRNSNRCIGRLFWKSLIVQDKRSVDKADDVYQALVDHIDMATNNGKILPSISIFHPKPIIGANKVRIWNHQLIGYAGYEESVQQIIGDPKNVAFTKICQKYGWKGSKGAFDVLPLVIQIEGNTPKVFELPKEKIQEVHLTHPDFSMIEQMNLRWYAAPIISDMVLEIGGILYPASPFNGWYMVTEIASRNLADKNRYNILPALADALDIKNNKQNHFWKDRALVILNEAVHHSFVKAGVTIVDHHTASDQFMKFMRNEKKEGRDVQADWTWIVPPMSSSVTDVFHQEMSNSVVSPNFYYNQSPFDTQRNIHKCPFHIHSLMGTDVN
ncbi:MAG: nitric oxide synthase oxygenase [Sphingobacteriales bacterium]|jgi:nitric-oxide synthase